jgi:hypothetical protein
MKSKISVRRRRGQSGNAVLEGALILLPFFAIILGIAEFSMVMFIMGLLQEDARTAARYVTTYNMTYNGAGFSTQTSLVQQMMIDGSLGFINTNNVNTYLQLNFYFPDDLTTPATAARLPHTWTDNGHPPQTQTVQWVNAPGNVAEVRVVNFPWNWMVPMPGFMPGRSITFGAEAVDVLQGLPVGLTQPPTP